MLADFQSYLRYSSIAVLMPAEPSSYRHGHQLRRRRSARRARPLAATPLGPDPALDMRGPGASAQPHAAGIRAAVCCPRVTRYFVRRVLWLIPVLLFVSLITFTLMHITPGGPWDKDKAVPPQIVANLNAKYNLDKPAWQQYLIYMGNARARRPRPVLHLPGPQRHADHPGRPADDGLAGLLARWSRSASACRSACWPRCARTRSSTTSRWRSAPFSPACRRSCSGFVLIIVFALDPAPGADQRLGQTRTSTCCRC